MAEAFDLSQYEGIPPKVLVMGGNWRKKSPKNSLKLSRESRIRVLALGVLAQRGLIDSAIFTAGLTKGPDKTSEASVQHGFFQRFFPEQAQRMHLLEEDKGNTTKKDAMHALELIEREGIQGPFTLLTSERFLRRQTKEFEHQGFSVVPVAAEPLVEIISDHYADFIHGYRHSLGYAGSFAENNILLGVSLLDHNSNLIQWIADVDRTNHN